MQLAHLGPLPQIASPDANARIGGEPNVSEPGGSLLARIVGIAGDHHGDGGGCVLPEGTAEIVLQVAGFGHPTARLALAATQDPHPGAVRIGVGSHGAHG